MSTTLINPDDLRTLSTGRRSLPVDLTDEEADEMRGRVGMHLREAGKIESRLDAAKSLVTAEKKFMEEKLVEARALSAVAESGRENRMVDVEVVLDVKGRTKHYLRMDTGEVYKTSVLDDEAQSDIRETGASPLAIEVITGIPRPKPENGPSLVHLIKTYIANGKEPGPIFSEVMGSYWDWDNEYVEATLWALINLAEVVPDPEYAMVIEAPLSVALTAPIHGVAYMLGIANDPEDPRNTGLGTRGGPGEEVEMEVMFAPVELAQTVRDHVALDGIGATGPALANFLELDGPQGEAILTSEVVIWCQAAGWIDLFALRDDILGERLWPPVGTTEGEALGAMYEIVTGEKPGKKKDATLRAAILEQRVEESP